MCPLGFKAGAYQTDSGENTMSALSVGKVFSSDEEMTNTGNGINTIDNGDLFDSDIKNALSVGQMFSSSDQTLVMELILLLANLTPT